MISGFIKMTTIEQPIRRKQSPLPPRPLIIAVDFDGTLCKERWPEIGPPNQPLIDWLILERGRGVGLILWTMREGEKLDAAIKWCAERGLQFDAVNDNLPEMQKRFGNNPRKVFADIYIDDHNM